MSAYIVSKDHVAIFVVGVNLKRHNRLETPDLLKQAKLLMRENVRSVNWRYGEKSRSPAITINEQHEAQAKVLSNNDLLQLARCLIYQSCETDDYYDSNAYHLICTLMVELYDNEYGDASRRASGMWSI